MNDYDQRSTPEHGWHQMNLICRGWQAAEQTAVHRLGPRLAQAERAGLLAGWWFTRKDARWRVRYQPHRDRTGQAQTHVAETMQDLAADDAIDHWTTSLYEPETHAFGGPDGMKVAHALFCADSHYLLDHLHRRGDRHRSELGLLLACALLRGAGQDWYEHGDVWARICEHRTADRPPTDDETTKAYRLLTGRTASDVCTPAWPAAFERTGSSLAELAGKHDLTRGLRAVLTITCCSRGTEQAFPPIDRHS